MSFAKTIIMAGAFAAGAETLQPSQIPVAEPNNYPANYEQIAENVQNARDNLLASDSIEESIDGLKDASEMGNKQASMMLSEIYSDGKYVDQDPKAANYYFKNAIFNSWSFPEPGAEQSINDPTQDLDYAFVMLPSVIANRVKSIATHGTASILYGDPELVESEQNFAFYFGRALRGIAEYAVSDMIGSNNTKKHAESKNTSV